MATSKSGNVKVEYHRMSGVPVNPNGPIDPGDLLAFDATTFLARRVTGPSDAVNCIGVSEHQVPVSSNLDIPELQGALNFITVVPLAIVEFTTGDSATYHVGDFVTAVTGQPQQVQKSGATQGNALGVVAAENKLANAASSFGGSIVSVSGTTKILIKLQPQGFLGRIQP